MISFSAPLEYLIDEIFDSDDQQLIVPSEASQNDRNDNIEVINVRKEFPEVWLWDDNQKLVAFQKFLLFPFLFALKMH